MDVLFCLGLQPQHKCLQMVLNVYLNWHVCKDPPEAWMCGSVFFKCVCVQNNCVTPKSDVRAFVRVHDIVWRKCKSVFGWNDLQLNWWPVKDQMRCYLFGPDTVRRWSSDRKEAFHSFTVMSNSTRIMGVHVYILLMNDVWESTCHITKRQVKADHFPNYVQMTSCFHLCWHSTVSAPPHFCLNKVNFVSARRPD